MQPAATYNDFWGMHVWDGALNPNPAWTDPVRRDEIDIFGPVFNVPLVEVRPNWLISSTAATPRIPGRINS